MDGLGKKIRHLRLKRSLTLKQLATATDLSVSFLSEIERGRSQPSMASLKKIRKALGVSLLTLVERGEAGENGSADKTDAGQPWVRYARETRLIRPGQRKRLIYPDRPGYYELLTPDLNRQLEVLYFKMESGFETGEFLVDPPGEKCLVVLSGSAEFHVAGEVFILEAGDSLSYPADASIRWKVLGDQAWEGMLIVTPPGF